ncbi:hypothetical protein CDAR_467471 [Caerostris darwini]|uniref:EGF-like domain-containing protein n=1 Tax=Caerostris darwini TaxID=1538125 RepID=A0AAV4RU80_9ARAC|nr:hypothetical protein CDAR_467471 [Caerostris darwini]
MSSATIENHRPFIDPKWLWDQHSEAEPSRDQCGMRLSDTSTIKVCATLQFYLNPFIGFGPTIIEIPLTCPNACHDHGNCHLGKCHCFPGYIGPDCADRCIGEEFSSVTDACEKSSWKSPSLISSD